MSYELTDFRTEVVEASKTTPIVLDFWAAWCGPCRTLGPTLEKLAGEARGKWKLVKVDTEQHQQLAAQFGIRSIPAVKMVYQGAVVAEFTGALPEAQVRKWLQDHLPESEEEKGFEEGIEAALASGDRESARRVLLGALEQNPDDAMLRARLAMMFLPGSIPEAEGIMKDVPEDSKFEIHRETLETLTHLRNLKKVPAAPDALAAAYLKSRNHLFNEAFDAAIEGFLDCMMKDRAMDDDGARKACVAIFTLLSDQHPVSKNYRRRFGMLLY